MPEVTDSTGDGLDDTLAQQVQDAIDVFKDAEQAAVMPCIVMVLSI
nr:hypothetical protein [Psychrobacter lutiphocae]